MMGVRARRHRKWCDRSAAAFGRFYHAIDVVREVNPANSTAAGDQLGAASHELHAFLSEDPCPDPVLAGIYRMMISSYSVLGTAFLYFEDLPRAEQMEALDRVKRAEGEVAALAEVLQLLQGSTPSVGKVGYMA
jgi:hypothetical protein